MKVKVLNFAWNKHQELLGSIGTVKRWVVDAPLVEINGKEYLVDYWEYLQRPRTISKTIVQRKKLSSRLRFKVFSRDSFTCQYCGKKPPQVILHIDHKLALFNGGTNKFENLVTACAECNLGKGISNLTT